MAIYRFEYSRVTTRAEEKVELEAVGDPKAVRDIIIRQAAEAREEHRKLQSTSRIEHVNSPDTGTQTTSAPTVAQLSPLQMLAELHRVGVLTAEEFASLAQRAATLS